MLIRATLSRGFTLIEIAITLAVIGVVLALGAPSFAAWIQNTQIRSATESMMTGISLARVEALKRNTTVRFQMMTSLDSSCGHSTDGNWVVSVGDAAGLCDVSDPTAPPLIIREKASGEGTVNVAYSVTPALVTPGFVDTIAFDALGRVTPAADGNIAISVTNPTGGTCAAVGGPMRCLDIQVTPGGQARMCDPTVTVAGDPRTC